MEIIKLYLLNKKKYIKILFIILIIIIIKSVYNINCKFCLKCYKNYRTEEKCKYCQNIIVFKGLKIASDEETLDEIILNNKSITRFGDGEFKIIFGFGVGFQNPNNSLSKKLVEVLNSEEKDLLIGLNIPYKIKDFTVLKKRTYNHWRNYVYSFKFQIANLINIDRKYYSATISRFYMRYKIKKNLPKYIKTLKKIWDSKNILIIEGKRSRNGIGNNLFNNANSIKRIICPSIDAFRVYDQIIREVIKIPEKRLILISLGPTATVLAYDLHKLGYQSIDIGHIDLEYEWYLRNCTHPVPIENKYVNEISDSQYVNDIVNDSNYYRQTIAIINV